MSNILRDLISTEELQKFFKLTKETLPNFFMLQSRNSGPNVLKEHPNSNAVIEMLMQHEYRKVYHRVKREMKEKAWFSEAFSYAGDGSGKHAYVEMMKNLLKCSNRLTSPFWWGEEPAFLWEKARKATPYTG